MSFCGKCGVPLGDGKFCPSCGAPVEAEQSKSTTIANPNPIRKSKLWKIAVLGVIVIATTIFIITRFAATTVDEPCDWCGNRPSVAYEMSDGSYSYVCKECGKECAWCGDKATKHYENLAGMMVFVCDDCYEEIAGD